MEQSVTEISKPAPGLDLGPIGFLTLGNALSPRSDPAFVGAAIEEQLGGHSRAIIRRLHGFEFISGRHERETGYRHADDQRSPEAAP